MNQQTERGEGHGPAGQPDRQQDQMGQGGNNMEGSVRPVRTDSPEAYDDAYETERENDFDQEETRNQG